MTCEINAIAIGLGAGKNRFGGPRDDIVHIARLAFERLARIVVHAHGEHDAGVRLIKFAGEMHLMAEPVIQEAHDLTQRYAGVGNLHLDIVGPVVGEARSRAAGIRLVLHDGEAVKQLVGDHLPGEAFLHHRRGHIE